MTAKVFTALLIFHALYFWTGLSPIFLAVNAIETVNLVFDSRYGTISPL